MGVKFKGFDEFTKKLDKLSGTHTVSFDELFLPEFMARNTKFENIDDFAEKSGFNFGDMDSIDDAELEDFVIKNTSFNSWQAMKTKAAEEWTARKLKF